MECDSCENRKGFSLLGLGSIMCMCGHVSAFEKGRFYEDFLVNQV